MMVFFALMLGLHMAPIVGQVTTDTPLRVVGVKASSTMRPWKGYTFDATNLIDGRVDTSWQPAKELGLGVGQWVELDLGRTYVIWKVEIEQGLQKVDPVLGDLFCRNNRFAEADLLFENGTSTSVYAYPSDVTVELSEFYRGLAVGYVTVPALSEPSAKPGCAAEADEQGSSRRCCLGWTTDSG